MDPIDSWVDAVELRKLAESLVAPQVESVTTPEITYGSSFVGFEKVAPRQNAVPAQSTAAKRPKNQARAALAGTRQAAEQGGILSRATETASGGTTC